MHREPDQRSDQCKEQRETRPGDDRHQGIAKSGDSVKDTNDSGLKISLHIFFRVRDGASIFLSEPSAELFSAVQERLQSARSSIPMIEDEGHCVTRDF